MIKAETYIGHRKDHTMSPWTWPAHALHPTSMLSFHPYGWNMQDNWWELMDEDLFAIHLLCPKVASYHLKVIVDTYNITMRESFSILIHTLHQLLPLHPILTVVFGLHPILYNHFGFGFIFHNLWFKWLLNYPYLSFKLFSIL